MRFGTRTIWCVAAFLTAALTTVAAMPQVLLPQVPAAPQAQSSTQGKPAAGTSTQGKPAAAVASIDQSRLSEYVLGPNDEIAILSVEIEGLPGSPVRINTNGDINLPQVGKIHVVGMTVGELEEEIIGRMAKYYKMPDITVSVIAAKSQPVMLLGLFRSPGQLQLEGRKTLLDVLAAAGPVQEASSYVTITRMKENGRIPLATAKTDDPLVSTAEVNWRALQNGLNPAQNIEILPYDVLFIKPAPIVVVVGEVKQAGRYALTERDSVSIKQLYLWVGGKTSIANSKNAKIYRPSSPGIADVTVNLDAIMSGKAKDIQLQGEDILFVPDSGKKRLLNRTVDSFTGTALGLPFYLIPF